MSLGPARRAGGRPIGLNAVALSLPVTLVKLLWQFGSETEVGFIRSTPTEDHHGYA